MISIILSFSAFGILLGSIVGLTEGEIAKYFLVILITLLGGLFSYFIFKNDKKIETLSYALLSFSLCCLIGLFGGIFLKVNSIFYTKQTIKNYSEYYIPVLLYKNKINTKTEKIKNHLRNIEKYKTPEMSEDLELLSSLINDINKD